MIIKNIAKHYALITLLLSLPALATAQQKDPAVSKVKLALAKSSGGNLFVWQADGKSLFKKGEAFQREIKFSICSYSEFMPTERADFEAFMITTSAEEDRRTTESESLPYSGIVASTDYNVNFHKDIIVLTPKEGYEGAEKITLKVFFDEEGTEIVKLQDEKTKEIYIPKEIGYEESSYQMPSM